MSYLKHEMISFSLWFKGVLSLCPSWQPGVLSRTKQVNYNNMCEITMRASISEPFFEDLSMPSRPFAKRFGKKKTTYFENKLESIFVNSIVVYSAGRQ